jgi:hypothetical protein
MPSKSQGAILGTGEDKTNERMGPVVRAVKVKPCFYQSDTKSFVIVSPDI